MEPPNRTLKPLATSMLPLDVIVNIISRLPVKSLLRFRCLSKFFRSLIDGQDFINLHLKCSSEAHSNRRLILSGFTGIGTRIFSANFDSLDNCVEVDHPFKNCRYLRIYDTLVIGSCNGLLAMHNRMEGIMLLNPSTKEDEILPVFIKDLCYCNAYFDGFGYDVATDDYKLVRIKVFNKPRLHSEVTVYSLKANSRKRIGNFPYHFLVKRGNGAFVDGFLHWVASRIPESDKNELMVAFDLNTEEFYEMSLPRVRDDAMSIEVEVLGGCLTLVCMYYSLQPCDVWLMKEYGVNDSWTKLFTFKEGAIGEVYSLKALAYSKSGDKVLVDINYGDLHWYDLKEQSLSSSVEIHGEQVDYYNVELCVDSLVSISAYIGGPAGKGGTTS